MFASDVIFICKSSAIFQTALLITQLSRSMCSFFDSSLKLSKESVAYRFVYHFSSFSPGFLSSGGRNQCSTSRFEISSVCKASEEDFHDWIQILLLCLRWVSASTVPVLLGVCIVATGERFLEKEGSSGIKQIICRWISYQLLGCCICHNFKISSQCRSGFQILIRFYLFLGSLLKRKESIQSSESKPLL